MEVRGGQFFAGNCLSWAELHFLQLTESLETMSPKVSKTPGQSAGLYWSEYNRNMFYLVPSRHTQPGESGGENQEPSQHQEMAGGATRHAVLENVFLIF